MSVRLIHGDCRDILATLPEESVHCVVTSPPYWGLRDYGTATWADGDPDCDHRQLAYPPGRETPGGRGGSMPMSEKVFREICGKCGGRRIDRQIGLEGSFSDYVEIMRSVFAEVRRVLRKDGTLWLNLGDSYNAYNGGAGPSSALSRGAQTSERPDLPTGYGLRDKVLKPKDLCGIPWRVAFALQADGWYLRSDIIWSKPNPMPESVTDRPTKAHEYIFLLSKSERYYYDAEAIREVGEGYGRGTDPNNKMFNRIGTGNKDAEHIPGGKGHTFEGGRNRRSVWEVATAPFSEAHFATFPPALIEPCILAGCPKHGTVLDPFGGAGTTGMVADRLGRNAILIELNSEYAEMAERRISSDAGMFAQVEAL